MLFMVFHVQWIWTVWVVNQLEAYSRRQQKVGCLQISADIDAVCSARDQVNAPLPLEVRQSDEDTRSILQEARHVDTSMQVPFWDRDIVEMEINPTPVSSMDTEANDWTITADELRDMLACMDVAPDPCAGVPAMQQAPQGLGGMGLCAAGGKSRQSTPSPALSTGSSGGFDPLQWRSHPVPAATHSNASSDQVQRVSSTEVSSSSPAGLGLGRGLHPRPRR
jgi:hypothetical protein